MAKRCFLRLEIYILSMPFIVISHIAELMNLWGLKKDIALCLSVLDSRPSQQIPKRFIEILVVAEDRRNSYHPGIDPIGILRAIWSILKNKGIQGASTVEQQFVRVVTDSYEMSIQRKIKEQAIAIAISRQRSKLQIASAYLTIAHYGYGLNGISGLETLCGKKFWDCPEQKIHELIARLKYPEPLQPSEFWNQRLAMRSDYIVNRIRRVGNDDTNPHLLGRSIVRVFQ